jgi:hypothetical protein
VNRYSYGLMYGPERGKFSEKMKRRDFYYPLRVVVKQKQEPRK